MLVIACRCCGRYELASATSTKAARPSRRAAPIRRSRSKCCSISGPPALQANARRRAAFRDCAIGTNASRPPFPPLRFTQMSIVEQGTGELKAGSARAVQQVAGLTRRFGLRLAQPHELTIRRLRRGKSFAFVKADGRAVKDTATLARLKGLAVPPAYSDVRYA